MTHELNTFLAVSENQKTSNDLMHDLTHNSMIFMDFEFQSGDLFLKLVNSDIWPMISGC